jgi:hypothetical protein
MKAKELAKALLALQAEQQEWEVGYAIENDLGRWRFVPAEAPQFLDLDERGRVALSHRCAWKTVITL